MNMTTMHAEYKVSAGPDVYIETLPGLKLNLITNSVTSVEQNNRGYHITRFSKDEYRYTLLLGMAYPIHNRSQVMLRTLAVQYDKMDGSVKPEGMIYEGNPLDPGHRERTACGYTLKLLKDRDCKQLRNAYRIAHGFVQCLRHWSILQENNLLSPAKVEGIFDSGKAELIIAGLVSDPALTMSMMDPDGIGSLPDLNYEMSLGIPHSDNRYEGTESSRLDSLAEGLHAPVFVISMDMIQDAIRGALLSLSKGKEFPNSTNRVDLALWQVKLEPPDIAEAWYSILAWCRAQGGPDITILLRDGTYLDLPKWLLPRHDVDVDALSQAVVAYATARTYFYYSDNPGSSLGIRSAYDGASFIHEGEDSHLIETVAFDLV